MEVTIILRRSTESMPQTRLTREEFPSVRGASPEDLGRIQEFAREEGLEVVEASIPRKTVVLSGTAEQFNRAFGVELKRYEHPKSGGSFRGREGPVRVPEELSQVILAILGLDDRPQAETHFRPLMPEQQAISTYTPPQLAKLYDYPLADGGGQCIGIVELGGGAKSADLDAYFAGLGIKTPKIVTVSVDGGKNSPTGDPSGPDGEVMLDIEVAGSIAPGATIALYFAPNTDRGFVDAVTTAMHDLTNKPTVVSISWGSAENTWTAQAIRALNQALEDASTLGVTICVASGDSGSSDGESDGLAHVDFPASSPYVLACGGTRLTSSGGAISSEIVWNDESLGGGASGGGISDVFPLPNWQGGFGVPPSANPGGHVGRGVPDVSGDADPATGYTVRVDGQVTTFGGTSAVAPLWASLIALVNQQSGKDVGYLNPVLYGKMIGTTRDITKGNNGEYDAKIGWDACTGLGSPDGIKILLDWK